jgi:hypothetical protein
MLQAVEGSAVEFRQQATEAEESPSLRFIIRKCLLKILQMNSHCGELLPCKD